MNTATREKTAVVVERDVPIPTWFGIGGGARRFARVRSVEELTECVRMDPQLRVLGDGANLLVDDPGVEELVIRLEGPTLTGWEFETGKKDVVRVGAGANLPKLIVEAVRRGRGGIEGLGGIPASVGGAVIMNAGGAFGQIGDVVRCVRGVDRTGKIIEIERAKIDFAYRHSGLTGLILFEAELVLREAEAGLLRQRLKEVMEYKKNSQPMADRSAGCVFKNPTLTKDLEGIGKAGSRVSAGMLIDRAGCKGMSVRGASVSPIHANFIVTQPGSAKARDVIELMDEVRERVRSRFSVELEPEVVVWRGRG